MLNLGQIGDESFCERLAISIQEQATLVFLDLANSSDASSVLARFAAIHQYAVDALDRLDRPV